MYSVAHGRSEFDSVKVTVTQELRKIFNEPVASDDQLLPDPPAANQQNLIHPGPATSQPHAPAEPHDRKPARKGSSAWSGGMSGNHIQQFR